MTAASATAASPRRVLLIGGTSEIGLSLLRRLAADGPVQPFLVGRRRAALEQALGTLEASGSSGGGVLEVDAEDLGAHEAAVAEAFTRAGGFDLVVLAVGQLGAQEGLDAPSDRTLEIMRVDFVGSGSLLMSSLRHLRQQGHGTLILLSSAAVERPRASNAVYGAAKTGLDALAQGLADSLRGSGVRVLVVRPGFVKTRMTAGLRPPPFSTTPEAVAEATVQALAGRAHTIWVPAAIRYVFMILRHLPRPVYRRLPV